VHTRNSGQAGHPPHLELKLTETFLMQDSKATALVLNALKQLGVQLALDDFGTGYSSLSETFANLLDRGVAVGRISERSA
jgi:EAL domain-containing protein (putative c-di-GMP-specific phosphodiesterase class I)